MSEPSVTFTPKLPVPTVQRSPVAPSEVGGPAPMANSRPAENPLAGLVVSADGYHGKVSTPKGGADKPSATSPTVSIAPKVAPKTDQDRYDDAMRRLDNAAVALEAKRGADPKVAELLEVIDGLQNRLAKLEAGQKANATQVEVAKAETAKEKERQEEAKLAKQTHEAVEAEEPGLGRTLWSLIEIFLRCVFPIVNVISGLIRLGKLISKIAHGEKVEMKDIAYLLLDAVGSVPLFGGVARTSLGSFPILGGAAFHATGWGLAAALGNEGLNIVNNEAPILGGLHEFGPFEDTVEYVDAQGKIQTQHVQVKNPWRNLFSSGVEVASGAANGVADAFSDDVVKEGSEHDDGIRPLDATEPSGELPPPPPPSGVAPTRRWAPEPARENPAPVASPQMFHLAV